MNMQLSNSSSNESACLIDMYNMIVNLQSEIKGLKQKVNLNLKEVWEAVLINHSDEIR